MDQSLHSSLKQLLDDRLDAVAFNWYRAVSDICLIITSSDDIQEVFKSFASEFLTLLLKEPFQPKPARIIGSNLADLHVLNPEIISVTQKVLTSEIIDQISSKNATYLHPRVNLLLIEFAIGFTEKVNEIILHEQELVRNSIELERQRIESEKKQIEQRDKAILSALPDVLVIINSEGDISFYHSGDQNRLYAPQNMITGKNLHQLLPPDVNAKYQEAIHIVINSNKSHILEYSLDVEGTIHHFDVRLVPYTADQVLAISRDITIRKDSEEALKQTNVLLEEMTRQLIETQETERINLARDLHDIVLNKLGAMVISSDDNAEISKHKEGYQTLTNYIRQTISGLRPPLLNYGLHTALESLCDELPERYNNAVCPTFEVPSSQERFERNVELHIFRILQQACENAIWHSQADNIFIFGNIEHNLVDLHVEDNGIGFELDNPTSVTNLLLNNHFGLAGMLERGALINANVEIAPKLGEGTRISVSWSP